MLLDFYIGKAENPPAVGGSLRIGGTSPARMTAEQEKKRRRTGIAKGKSDAAGNLPKHFYLRKYVEVS